MSNQYRRLLFTGAFDVVTTVLCFLNFYLHYPTTGDLGLCNDDVMISLCAVSVVNICPEIGRGISITAVQIIATCNVLNNKEMLITDQIHQPVLQTDDSHNCRQGLYLSVLHLKIIKIVQ